MQGSPAAAGNGTAGLANNPFIEWVKKNYPQQAAQIITSYLAQTPGAPADANRDQLRAQVLGVIARQLQANVQKALPQGLTATIIGQNVQVSGVTNYQGHDIYVRFEFWNRLLPNGAVQITQPTSTTYAEARDLLAKWFGGDITAQAQAKITTSLDQAGPDNAAPHVMGVQYYKGGTFIIDPGVAFVNMPPAS